MVDISKLRYSPVNGLVINWSHNGEVFNDCGLPKPIEECVRHPHTVNCCEVIAPIEEVVDTYGWERWLHEVIIGVDNPDEEIAASYVREVAKEFAAKSQVLQRKMYIVIQDGVSTYPLTPASGETIIGVLAMIEPDRHCVCGTSEFANFRTSKFSFDMARSEVTIRTRHTCGVIELIVWAAPSEDACLHDVFLYDHFRRPIAQEARMRYVLANHFRDVALLRSVQQPQGKYNKDITKARVDATRWMNRNITKSPTPLY